MTIWVLYFLVFALGIAGALLTIRVEKLRSALLDLSKWAAEAPTCRVCNCTDEVACLSGCWWVEPDLCSSCADDMASSLEAGG